MSSPVYRMSPILTDGHRFLFVGKNTLDTLAEIGSNYRGESDKGPLETLFPRLVVVFLRTSEPENRNPDRNRRDAPASPPRSTFSTNVVQVRADIYRPVKPFDLMSACVIGTYLRQTCIAGTVIQEASLEPDDAGPRRARTIDNVYKITFHPNGKFLPQSQADVFRFPGRVGDHPGIEIDPTTLDDDASLGSRSRDIARGIFDLLPSRGVGLGEHSILPKIKVAGKGVAFKPLFAEVSSVFVFFLGRVASDRLHRETLQLVSHFPVRATIEIADKKLRSLSQTVDAIKWTATRLQARYDALDVPHEGYNQILDVRAMGAADSKTNCSWFGTLFDRHRRVGGTLANGDAVPPGIGYRQLHYFDTEREQSMLRHDWVYPAGQEGKVVLIEEMRETRTRG